MARHGACGWIVVRRKRNAEKNTEVLHNFFLYDRQYYCPREIKIDGSKRNKERKKKKKKEILEDVTFILLARRSDSGPMGMNRKSCSRTNALAIQTC